MDKWHYHTQEFDLKDLHDVDKLNHYGELGWEIVAVKKMEPKPLMWLVIFKKLVTDTE